MLPLNNIFSFLNRKERKSFYLLLFLTLVNTLLEVLGISAVIPLVSLTLKQDLSLFENFFFYEYVLNFSMKDNFIIYSFLAVLSIFIFKNTFIIFYNWYFTKYYNLVGKRLSDDICKIYINLTYRDYLELKSSKPIYQCTEGVEIFKQQLYSLITFILELLVAVSFIIFLIFLNPTVSFLIIFLISILSLSVFVFFFKKNKHWGEQVKKEYGSRIDTLNQIFFSFKDIKIFNSENFFLNKFKKHNFGLNMSQYKNMFLITVPKPYFEMLLIGILILSLYFFLEIISLPSEEVVLILSVYAVAFFRLYPSMTKLSQSIQKFNFGRSTLISLRKILDKKVILRTNEFLKKKSFINEKIQKIELKNINFSYSKINMNMELKNVNCNFKKNIFYGIMGETGTGKSTLIDIISGLLVPTSGDFIINDKVIDTLGNSWLEKISYVPQNISLTNDSLEKNIALGVENNFINKEKIEKIIKIAELENFSERYNNRSSLTLGERGLQISGGEKQRIGIARALYFDREIFIFDEATNALDLKTETKIIKNLKENLINKLVLFVSHKKNTLNHCDQILEVKDNTIKHLNGKIT